jgi:hypothetical protein
MMTQGTKQELACYWQYRGFLFRLQLLSAVTRKCTAPEEKGGIVCLSDIQALHKMQRELTAKKVDITLYLAFGFKQLSGENSDNLPHQGKWKEKVCMSKLYRLHRKKTLDLFDQEEKNV